MYIVSEFLLHCVAIIVFYVLICKYMCYGKDVAVFKVAILLCLAHIIPMVHGCEE